jgi:DNA-binding transcriptional LysR family regulator
VLAPATARFTEQHPGVQVRVAAQNWDELARQLRGRELDFFIAETSTLQREPDLEVTALGTSHPVYFFARAGHPLAGAGPREIAQILSWPFVSPSRIPPRMLDPLLAGQRQAARLGGAPPPPFPAVECNAVAPVRRIVRDSDVVSASILPCISRELEAGEFMLLGREPWMHLHYGIVRLARHPLTQVAERYVEFVMESERAAVAESERLVHRFG